MFQLEQRILFDGSISNVTRKRPSCPHKVGQHLKRQSNRMVTCEADSTIELNDFFEDISPLWSGPQITCRMDGIPNGEGKRTRKISNSSLERSDQTQTTKNSDRFVRHNYTDRLLEPEPRKYLVKSDRTRASTSFPGLLYYILQHTDEEETSHILSWQPHGRCFIVRDQRAFVDRVMPRYFETSKFASFQRQLNLYGFSRLCLGRDKGAYYHEYFLRGRPDLLTNMQRVRVKGHGVKRIPVTETEPDFYKMPYCLGPNAAAGANETGIVSRMVSQSGNLPVPVAPPLPDIDRAVVWEDLLPIPHETGLEGLLSAVGSKLTESDTSSSWGQDLAEPDLFPFGETVACRGEKALNGMYVPPWSTRRPSGNIEIVD